MPITVNWDNNDHTIASWTLTGQWTWAEFRAAQVEFHDLLRAVDHIVDVIADMREAGPLPAATLTHFRSAQLAELPNRDRIVLVGGGGLVRSIAGTFNRVFRIGKPPLFLFADTVEDARDLLARE
ncbi:MAG: hypothetical protein JXQ72_13840 [Anaerolineae bacterium]|nr:hypothetical protein [Anaerolineae bacterium]